MRRLGLHALVVVLPQLMVAHWARWDFARQSPLHGKLPRAIGRVAELELQLK